MPDIQPKDAIKLNGRIKWVNLISIVTLNINWSLLPTNSVLYDCKLCHLLQINQCNLPQRFHATFE